MWALILHPDPVTVGAVPSDEVLVEELEGVRTIKVEIESQLDWPPETKPIELRRRLFLNCDVL